MSDIDPLHPVNVYMYEAEVEVTYKQILGKGPFVIVHSVMFFNQNKCVDVWSVYSTNTAIRKLKLCVIENQRWNWCVMCWKLYLWYVEWQGWKEI